MKFGQLIEYNMRNIFLENLYSNMVEKIFPKFKTEHISESLV